eukprot:scaffold167659_cov21-Tisochrysis_lutea.AAC.1
MSLACLRCCAHQGSVAKGSIDESLHKEGGGAHDAAALCPQSCSGNGRCLAPPPMVQATYMCRCDQGWGGAMCEGRLSTLAVAPTMPVSLPSKLLRPGQWDFFLVNVEGSYRA